MPKRANLKRLLGLTLAILLVSSPVRADTLVQVNSVNAQGATDSVQWSQLGADATSIGSSANVSSVAALGGTVTLAGPNSLIAVVCPSSPCSWAGVGFTAGDSVLWTWSGGDMHSVTADDNSFDDPASGSKASGTFSHQFNTPGTYAYYCRVHGGPGGSGMHGVVVVNAAAPTATTTNTPAPTATAPAATRTPTNTPVASMTATAARTTTPPATPPTSMPGPSATVAPPVSTPTGAVAALPSTGGGTTARGVTPLWLIVVLATGGAVAVTVAANALTRQRT